MNSKQKQWGLVLSGGAAYGLANVGMLEVLEEHDLKPAYIAGSSMGAIVGSLAALGLPASLFRTIAEQLTVINVASFQKKPFRDGLHGGLMRQEIETLLGPHIGNACIGDCEIPFVCVAGRMKEPIDWLKIFQKGFTEHVLSCVEKYTFPPETKLMDALLATSAIPVLFSPMKIGDDTFIDLCNYGAIPARTLRDVYNPEVLLATNTNPRMKALEAFLPGPWRHFIEAGEEELARSIAVCDFVIEPEMVSMPLRFDKAAEFMDEGKRVAEERIEEIIELLY